MSESVRIIKQYQLADDWFQIRPECRELAESLGFEVREMMAADVAMQNKTDSLDGR